MLDHHFAPTLVVSSNKACLAGVRSAPPLRGKWGMFAALRRAARRAPSSAMSMTVSSCSAGDVFDAIIAHAFLADAALKIRLIDAVGRAA